MTHTAALAEIADALPHLVGVFDREGRFRHQNQAYEAWYGRPRSEMLGRTLRELLGNEAGPLLPHLTRALGGERADFQETVRYPTGDRVVRGAYIPCRDASPGAAVVAFIMDVTGEVRHEAALRRELAAVETLSRSAASLLGQVDRPRLLQAITDDATALSGAAFGAFFHRPEDPGTAPGRLDAFSGAPREAFEPLRDRGPSSPVSAHPGVVRSDDVRVDRRFDGTPLGDGGAPGRLSAVSYLSVPVVARDGGVLGALVLGHPEPGRFGPVEERMVTGLAAHAGIALETARLFEASERSREAANRAERRFRFLAEASEVLASSLDYEVTVEAALQAALGAGFADLAAADLARPDGGFEPLVQVARDEEVLATLRAVWESHPPDPDAEIGSSRVLRTGIGELIAEVPPALLASVARDEEHRRLLERLALRSVVLAPMNARGRTFGVLWLARRAPHGAPYDAEDLALASRLGERVALAIDHAELYRAGRRRGAR